MKSWKYGQLALRDDPWGHGNSLEWATSSPPPRHNFLEIPRIRSERPAFEAHYPHLIDRLHDEAHSGKRHKPYAGVSELVGDTAPARAPNDPDPDADDRAPAGRRRRPGAADAGCGTMSRAAGPDGRPRRCRRVTGGRPARRHRPALRRPGRRGRRPAVEVVDVEQVVVHGHLVLGVVVAACPARRPAEDEPRCSPGWTGWPPTSAAATGVRVRVEPRPGPTRTPPAPGARTT